MSARISDSPLMGIGASFSGDLTRDYSFNFTEKAIRYGSRLTGALATIGAIRGMIEFIPYTSDLENLTAWGTSALLSLIPIKNKPVIKHVVSAFGTLGDVLAKKHQANRYNNSIESLENEIGKNKIPPDIYSIKIE